MEEQRVIRLSVLNQPVHGPNDIILGRDTHGILLVVGEDDHILATIPEAFVQEGGHVGDVVDTSIELIGLTEIVDPNEQGFPPASTSRVLELVIGWRTMAKLLEILRRPGWEIGRIGARWSYHTISVWYIIRGVWKGAEKRG